MKLKVAEAIQMDVGRSIARVNSDVMDSLKLESGDIISIKAKSEALAVVWRARPEDENKPIIRVDGITRFNTGSSMGDDVTIKKVKCEIAGQVTIAPVQHPIKFRGNPEHYFLDKLMDKPILKGNQIVIDILGTSLNFMVTSTTPKGAVKITQETSLSVLEKPVSPEALKIPEVTYEDIGGLHEEIEQIREMIELPMKHPEVFERLGIGAPKGVLLSGPPGTGKTLLAKAVASETESQFFSINGPEIMSKYYGESEKKIRKIFKDAEDNAPSVIFIDELDSIAPKREEVTGEVERRVVAQLLTLMDGLESRGQVVVVAATNRPDALDPALRRPGRFDREIKINVPNTESRKEVLLVHTRGMPLAKDVSLDKISDMTYGYTGADLEVLCKEAALKSLRKYIPDLKSFEEKLPTNVLEKIEVKMEHFIDAFRKVEPSAMREVLIRKPKTKWSDIGGLEDVKESLKEMIELPLKNPEYFREAGIKPAKGVLLYGPPGCGKTLMAKAIANEADANFISVKGPELISKWVGESEKHVREIFKKARQVAPSIVFFDEFDSIAGFRTGSEGRANDERVVNQLLTELDGIEDLSGVMVIAATNRPDLIDPALMRPGRFDDLLEIPIPDADSRKKIFEVHTEKMPIELDKEYFDTVVKKTEGMSGAEIENVCREAGMYAIKKMTKEKGEDIKMKVEETDFDSAFRKIKKKKQEKENKTPQTYIA
ncbi:MAG: CDC48 family AAA ATPase [Candidatus Woesearchaeota archaeon]